MTILLYCLLAYTILLALAMFASGNYVFELVITMLPYWLILNTGIAVIFLLSVLSRQLPLSLSPVSFLPMLAFGIVTMLMFFQFFQFSYLPLTYLPKVEGYSEDRVNIAFFNKLYSNTNYEAINIALSEVQPDIIGLTELKLADIPSIPALKQYQCSLIKNARDNATIALFSRYPCEVISDIAGTKYILPLTLKMQEKDYHVFVIHPLPPGKPSWLKERNKELSLLSEHIRTLNSENVIVLGDFNTSPWSTSFRQFAKATGLKNTAQGQGASFTFTHPVIKTHIDHMYVPRNMTIQSFHSVPVKGSDHQLIWTSLKL